MRTNRASRMLLAAAAGLVCVLATPGTAIAIPGGGASPDTPGTSASVRPATAAAGAQLTFTVRGFPAGETVNVKIDDGSYCGQAATRGACVVHTEQIDADGTVSGGFPVPADLAPGAHWLRFLATAPLLDANGKPQGAKGFTLRGGSDFTVTAPPAPAPAAPAPAPARAPASAAPAPAPPAPPAPPQPATAAAPPPSTTAATTPVVSPTTVATAASAPSQTPVQIAVADAAASGPSEGGGAVWILVAAVVVAVGGGIAIFMVLRRPLASRGEGSHPPDAPNR